MAVKSRVQESRQVREYVDFLLEFGRAVFCTCHVQGRTEKES